MMALLKFIVLLYINILMRETNEMFLFRFFYLCVTTTIVLGLLIILEHFIIPYVANLFNWVFGHLRERYLADGPLVPRFAPENFPNLIEFLVRFHEFRHFA